MKWEVLSVYDSKARVFMKPFYNTNVAVGVRLFADVANDPEQSMCRNGADYTLFHLGTWEDDKGAYEQFAQPINLGLAESYKR